MRVNKCWQASQVITVTLVPREREQDAASGVGVMGKALSVSRQPDACQRDATSRTPFQGVRVTVVTCGVRS